MVTASVLFACWILLQTPAVQTFAARKAVEALGDALNGRVEFSKIHLKPFSALVLNDVVIIDNAPVTDWNGDGSTLSPKPDPLSPHSPSKD